MGIVNVTPDSFSDGGHFFETQKAVDHALKLAQQGADILDIGGESTRPYSQSVDEPEELRRVIPVVQSICKQTGIPVSIDTSKSVVARQAVDAGAHIVNDITGLQGDPNMLGVVRDSGVGVCVMHMLGTPQTMQDNPQFANVVEDILAYLQSRKQELVENGIDEKKICLDPGIGFGKTHDHNLQLLRDIARFHETGCPLLVGHSRKGFVKKVTDDPTDQRLAGTLAVSLHLARNHVQVIRVHDVLQTKQALTMQAAIDRASAG